MVSTLGLFLLLQQPAFLGATTPPSGDTTGYWQQRVSYRIVATLDETRNVLRARGEMVYVNNSPDTLREMFVHQYLNAFRPQSAWSRDDEREGRVRFQNLGEPDFGYETFTQAPVVDGTPVLVEYPGAPDSTVARFRLPRPLRPGDSVRVELAWEARPSTVARRQGRRGRSWDFAHWYPKVAVYDRGGWQANPLVPAGEFYGEFGTYDVTLVLRDDQVVGSVGVPVEGDPGYDRARRDGEVRLAAEAYGPPPPRPEVAVPAGSRLVRFVAHDVHHFAWSASPDYRYEGAVYARPAGGRRYSTFDTVAIHVLYRPNDDTTWGRGIVARRTADALRWLESMYGPYPYPQITVLHRIDGGGTEFPMVLMNGSPSYGLILHELGHVYTYGILANNEWRSAFLDEGFTDYQTRWAQGLTPQERARAGAVPEPPRLAPGYRVNAVIIPRADSTDLPQHRLALIGRAEPIGRSSPEFREFTIYNLMVYDRAAAMYAHLRDVLGDSGYVRMTRDLYERWAFRHFDERALRASAERVHGASLGWFFDQWVHQAGLLDYGLGDVTITQEGGEWVTRAEVVRQGEYAHPMPVGIHTSAGWRIGRARVDLERQILEMRTAEAPDSVRIDPLRVTWDWDRRNDTQSAFLLSIREPRIVVDWPFLDQSDREHTIVALRPRVWFSDPLGLAVGVGARANYLSMVDRHDGGLAIAARRPDPVEGKKVSPLSQLQFWARAWNLYLPGLPRPLMGWRGDLNWLDGIAKIGVSREMDLSQFVYANGYRLEATAGITTAFPTEGLLLPEQWSDMGVTELSGSATFRMPRRADSTSVSATLDLGLGYAASGGELAPASRGYGRILGTTTSTVHLIPGQQTVTVRLAAGWTPNAPAQRSIFASSRDPFQTFENDYYRPRGALLKQDWINFVPIGGFALRGVSPQVALEGGIAANGEGAQRLYEWRGPFGRLAAWATVFADAGVVSYARESSLRSDDRLLLDAGAGLALRGRFYDRDVRLRLDFPLFVSSSGLALAESVGDASFAFRWALSFNDPW